MGNRAVAMIMALALLGAALAAAALFWPDAGRNTGFSEPLTAKEFSLGGERFKINLPRTAHIAEDPSGAFVWIEMRPGVRASPSIWLETPYDDTQPFAYDGQRRIGGVSVHYRLSLNRESAGSGGQEANLDGRIAFKGRLWSLSCVAQREGIEASEADWCLPLLAGLKVAE